EVKGVGDAVVATLKIVHAAANRFARGEVNRREPLSSWSAVLDYCRTAQAFAEIEQFRILFLDKRNQLIADEVQQTGTVDHTPVYPREVVKRALELSATAVVLVHKDPSCGCCSGWVQHLQKAGFQVKIIETRDIDAVKMRLGVP